VNETEGWTCFVVQSERDGKSDLVSSETLRNVGAGALADDLETASVQRVRGDAIRTRFARHPRAISSISANRSLQSRAAVVLTQRFIEP
jgi:hypothetical protein